MHKYFNKGVKQMTNKHMKKFSPLLTLREIQIKTIMRYHQIITMDKVKNNNTKCSQ